MAKGKSAAALFEVIHGAKRVQSSEKSNLNTPKWWFKSKIGGGSGGPAHAPAPVDVAPAPAAPRIERFAQPIAHDPISASAGASGTRSPRPTVRLEMQYSTAVFFTFMLAVAIAGAYVAGRAFRIGPTPVIASETTEQLLSGPAQPGVMQNVTGASVGESAGVADSAYETALVTGSNQSAVRPAQKWNEPKPPTTAIVDDANRVMKLNYVVVQSYPDLETAEQVRDLLIRNGVGATVEKGTPFAPNWYSVVGTLGFDNIRNSREYNDYKKRIEQIGADNGVKGKWKRFEPQAMSWKGSSGNNN